MHEYLYHPNGTVDRVVVTREAEWDDEQVQNVLDHLDYKRLTARCGHHPTAGMAADHVRMVEHAPVQCLDCYAIEHERSEFHKKPGHTKNGPCPACEHEVFWIESRDPL